MTTYLSNYPNLKRSLAVGATMSLVSYLTLDDTVRATVQPMVSSFLPVGLVGPVADFVAFSAAAFVYFWAIDDNIMKM